MSKFSVKRPFVVIVAVIVLLVLGVVSYTRMTTDLLPNMNLPYMVVVTTYAGASPEKVQSEVGEVLESSVGTVNGVKEVVSTASENYSMIMLEFEDDTDIDSAMVKVTSAVNQVSLPDGAGTPIIMEISMDMMATMMTSVEYDDTEGAELSAFIEDNIIPEIERQDGVASVSTSGLVEESIEVQLNQDKIDEVNEKILEVTNEELAKAKKKLDKAQKALSEGKEELESQQENLEEQEEEQSDELAQYSKLMNQAIATKQAYQSNLTSLKAEKSALKMEKKAYEDNGVVASYDALNEGFKTVRASLKEGGTAYQAIYDAVYEQVLVAAVQAQLDASGVDATVTADTVEDYLQNLGNAASEITDAAADTAAATAREQAETQLESLPKSVKDAINHPAKLKAYKALLKSQGQTDAAKQITKKNLKSLYNIVEVRIPQINTELANLKTEIAAAKEMVKQVNESIAEAEDQYEQVEAGKITAAAAFGSADAQLSSAQSALEESEAELEEGLESYQASKKEALKNANLDSLLTMSQLSTILSAENFSMPAGYISEDGTQYLIKVGDEYESIDEMKSAVLCEIDDVGDICLEDVADIVLVDNSADSYARVNGNDAVVLSISKSSTAGTSAVSKACNEKFEELTEEYEGFGYMNLLDQGDYIEMVVDSVISNLLWGALLAVVVLLLFLRDIRPTIVVGFAIPLSVLFAIVLMYFTNITLNMISLVGLALGIGMLVDNSVVVIENIYRLRNKGVPAARAAVMGANQVAGAIFSSTLTTICVFLPIIFTDGITRQMLQDMCLTITYSLSASLIVALTVVPCMGANLLGKESNVKHRWFDALVRGYERVARFCLRFKAVPICIAVALLVFSVVQVMQMGIVFIPSMGSDQMTASVTMDAETTTEEDYALADTLLEQIQGIEGVDTVGAIMGSTTSTIMGTSASGSKDYTYMIVLEEDYANKNKQIASEIEDIFEANACEEYSVSESNMDMSSMMSSGLAVDIYGNDMDTLVDISEDVMEMVRSVEGYEEPENGQEAGDKEVLVKVDKDKAMRLGLTVAQVYSELAQKLTTEQSSTTLTVGDSEYEVTIVDERDELNTDNLAEYEFEVTSTDTSGETKTKTYKLEEFATIEETTGVATLNRENLVNYVEVTAAVADGYNATLLSRELQKLVDDYETPDGYEISVEGESETTQSMVNNMMLMIGLAIIFIYLIMVAQFQGFLSPFIVLLTIPLAFTGGLIALLLSGEDLSVMALMGFLLLSGVIVNNGIVFVDYANKLRISGMEKHEALIETGKTRMRPILMTALTTILAMSVMIFSRDTAASLSRGMAIVVVGGLAYATLMTLFVVPVFYDIFYRKPVKVVDLGDEASLDEVDDII